MKPHAFIGMPTSDGTAHVAAVMAMGASCLGKTSFEFAVATSTALSYNFNQLYARALDRRPQVTHFAMIHSDVCPGAGWLDVLMEEMDKHDADLISAVIPLRNKSGLTSTCLAEDPWGKRHVLSLKEIFDLYKSETFTDFGLLTNTGLMLLNLDGPWAEQVVFRQQERIRKVQKEFDLPQPDSSVTATVTRDVYEAVTLPEDWDFSHQIKTLGGKVFATRKVRLYHGHKDYHNHYAWGDAK